jgi:acyl-CoA reductase-like NAD-dependent aldehyde dehydrogenase
MTNVSTDVPVARCLIGGEWVDGDGQMADTLSPVTGELISRVRYSSVAQVDAAAKAARKAQKEWGKLSIPQRAEILIKLLDAIAARKDEIAGWIEAEVGTTPAGAEAELMLTIPVAKEAIQDALRFTGVTQQTFSEDHPSRRIVVMHKPIGVGAFISPFNFPVEMIFNMVAAMIVGNACVWKPSEACPYSPSVMAQVITDTGLLPDGLINIVYGGADVGDALVRHEHVGFICFIGSSPTGEAIARAAGMKRLLLECGGNGPLIVLNDANVDAAVARAIHGCFFLAGQICTASERILLQSGIHDEFVAKLAEKAKALKVGDPRDPSTDMGPLVSKVTLDKTIRHIEEAKAKGATVVFGGGHDGMYHEPTILVGVTNDMEIAREETFGPVAPCIKFDTLEEAIALANDSDYGLVGAVYSESLSAAWTVADALETGTVRINAGTSDWERRGPSGGVKRSGIGRELGNEGLRAFTQTQTLMFHID